MSPTNDYIFHRIFGHVGNEEITKGLIGTIINQDIKNIKIDETPITEQNIRDDKIGILDIKARLDDDILCDVEMQVAKKDSIEKRIMFYWSKLYSAEIHKGEDFDVLHKTIVILIANFELDKLKEIPKFHTKWQIREEEYGKIVLTDTLEIHIIELPKLIQQLKVNKGIKKDKIVLWLLFILNPENVGDEYMNENEDLKLAKEELERIKQDEKDQRLAELRMKYILDQNSIRKYGFKEGLKKGLEKSEKKIKEEKLIIAKKLLELKMPIKQIIQVTELTEDEIKNI